MSEQKRGIGDNSKISEAKVFTDYVSPLEPKEVLSLIKNKLEFIVVKNKLVKWCNNNY